MSGENIVRGDTWLANLSRLSYNFDKSYELLLHEQDVELLDDELNTMQLMALARHRKFISTMFGNGSPDAGMQIIGMGTVNDFTVKAGNILVDGWLISLAVDTSYLAQPIGQTGLTTPGVDRTDRVYLDIYLDEVSGVGDNTIIDPSLGVRTSTRLKLNYAIKVAEGTTVPANGLDGQNLFHWYYGLATINRLGANNTITAAMVVDVREVRGNTGGRTATLAVETTLTDEGLVWLDPPEGTTVLYHLPVYGTIAATKQYRYYNIGQGQARFDTTDGTLIDNDVLLNLAPGDRGDIIKDGTNWRTF
jgi:hypothetical protein